MINYKYLGIIILLFLLCLLYNYKPKYNLYNGPYWDSYRLGDIVNGYMIRSDDPKQKKYLKDISTRWPNSIADKYVKQSGYPKSYKMNDLHILQNILDGINYDKPDKNTLVIHLRLGDTVEMWKKGEIQSWMNGKTHYVKGPDYYKQLLPKLKEITDIHNIDIIVGVHYNIELDDSIEYLDNIVDIFKNDYNVNVKITNNPDKDFYYMCHSEYFCPSGGGYSNLVKSMVKLYNNEIIMK